MEVNSKVSPSLEDYLETIYFIYTEKGSVRVTDVANALNISKPSVNKAINILKTKEYVSHEHYGLLSLTESGMNVAKSVARRHVTIKRFLTDLLKVDEKVAEDEACRIEHQMSGETVEKLADYLDKTLK